MITIAIPAFCALFGALVYALSTNSKVSTLGLIAYAVGLFWVIYLLLGKVTHL